LTVKPEGNRHPIPQKGAPQYARRLPVVYVWISPVNPELTELGLNLSRVEEEVVNRLNQAGLMASSLSPFTRKPRYPCLGLLIHGDRIPTFPHLCVFSIEAFHVQKVTAAKPKPVNSLRMVWCREVIGEVSVTCQGVDWSNLYRLAGVLVEQFLNESLELSTNGDHLRAAN
jgi:hypothetical protein